MINLFAFRSTNPKGLSSTHDPVGPENDHWITALTNTADIVVAAWGNHGSLNARDEIVLQLIKTDLYSLSITGKNMPGHPLYLPKNSTLQKYQKI